MNLAENILNPPKIKSVINILKLVDVSRIDEQHPTDIATNLANVAIEYLWNSNCEVYVSEPSQIKIVFKVISMM